MLRQKILIEYYRQGERADFYAQKQFKKLFAVLLCLALVLSLAACGGSSGSSGDSGSSGSSSSAPADSGSSASNEVQELTFWHSWSGGNAELPDAMAAKFNETRDNINVTAAYQGDYWESASKAYTAVATGEAPDLLMMGTDHVSIFMKEGGVLENLIPYMDATGYNKADLVPGFTDRGRRPVCPLLRPLHSHPVRQPGYAGHHRRLRSHHLGRDERDQPEAHCQRHLRVRLLHAL